MSNKNFLYVIPDSLSNFNEEDKITCFTSFNNKDFKKFDYVKIIDSEVNNSYWIAQIITPNITVSLIDNDILSPTILESISSDESALDCFQKDGLVHVYKLSLLKYIDNEEEKSLLTRPIAGSKAEKLSKNYILTLLDMPIKDPKICNVIGTHYHDPELPVCIDRYTFDRHIVVSGSTGSGKSNVNVNLIKIARDYGKAVIVHDAKPDFSEITKPNDEKIGDDKYWGIPKKHGFTPIGLNQRVGFIGFYNTTKEKDIEMIIYMRPQSFSPQEFCDLFLFDQNDELANESFLDYLIKFHADNSYSRIKKSFSFQKFKDLINFIKFNLNGKGKEINNIIAESKFKEDKDQIYYLLNINQSTFKSMYTKIFRRFEKFNWLVDTNHVILDKDGKEIKDDEANGNGKKYYSDIDNFIFKILKSKSSTCPPILIFNYDGDHDGILYSIMVRKTLKIVQNIRDDNPEFYEVVQLIDEAHRLFDSASKQYKERLIESFNKVIKEGRVKKHSIILSLQNISEVPPQAINNLGTQIVLRQISTVEGNAATATMDKSIGKQVFNLLPGNFLLKYHNGKSTLNVNGFLSSAKLRRGD